MRRALIILGIGVVVFTAIFFGLAYVRFTPVLRVVDFVWQQQQTRSVRSLQDEATVNPLYAACTVSSFDEDEFLFVLNNRFPEFVAEEYTLGEQPQFDASGQFLGDQEQFESASSIVLSRSRLLGLEDPRILATLIELETQGLSRPNQHPDYPLNFAIAQRLEGNFTAQVTDAAGLLHIRYSNLADEPEAWTLAIYSYLADKYQGQELQDKLVGPNSFRAVFSSIFGTDPASCGEEL